MVTSAVPFPAPALFHERVTGAPMLTGNLVTWIVSVCTYLTVPALEALPALTVLTPARPIPCVRHARAAVFTRAVQTGINTFTSFPNKTLGTLAVVTVHPRHVTTPAILTRSGVTDRHIVAAPVFLGRYADDQNEAGFQYQLKAHGDLRLRSSCVFCTETPISGFPCFPFDFVSVGPKTPVFVMSTAWLNFYSVFLSLAQQTVECK